MKTYKHLFEKYISDENIELSLSTAVRGDKAKRTKHRLQAMLNNKEYWVPKLREIAMDFHPHKHVPKEIYDGVTRKKRTIIVPSVVELVIQHMQVNVLKSVLMKGMYEHTYAAIPNRGAHKGAKVVAKWLRKNYKHTKYCLKIDVRHFFESVNLDVLKAMLARIIKDDRFLEALYQIIDMSPKGLPLGFYTSQWYANFYLKQFDHYIKEKLGVKFYMRYMDDMIFLGGNKRAMHKLLEKIIYYLDTELHLTLKGNYTLFKVGIDKSNFIDFMGFRFYRNRTTLRRAIMLKAVRKAKRIAKKSSITVYDARQMMAYIGWLDSTDSYDIYLNHIKPYISFKTLKKIVSRHDRKVNKLCGTKRKVA